MLRKILTVVSVQQLHGRKKTEEKKTQQVRPTICHSLGTGFTTTWGPLPPHRTASSFSLSPPSFGRRCEGEGESRDRRNPWGPSSEPNARVPSTPHGPLCSPRPPGLVVEHRLPVDGSVFRFHRIGSSPSRHVFVNSTTKPPQPPPQNRNRSRRRTTSHPSELGRSHRPATPPPPRRTVDLRVRCPASMACRRMASSRSCFPDSRSSLEGREKDQGREKDFGKHWY